MAVIIIIAKQLIVQKVFARNLLKDVWQHAVVTGQERDRSNLCLHSRRSIITPLSFKRNHNESWLAKIAESSKRCFKPGSSVWGASQETLGYFHVQGAPIYSER